MHKNIVKSLSGYLNSRRNKVPKQGSASGIKLAEDVLNKYLLGSTLLGLNKMDEFPEGYGNLLLFSKSDLDEKATMQLEVLGGWIWIDSSLTSFVINDDEKLPLQSISTLLSISNLHVGKKVTGIKLWEALPHIAIEFSDGSLFVIHGDNSIYESWAFDNWEPISIGVYALPGGPIAVG
jgi:hypothetical protein